ncbi:MAG: hypothetical protein Q8R56_12430 [Polaromonas sp.]|nr:hypothetical protein [Polaromonas sp.]
MKKQPPPALEPALPYRAAAEAIDTSPAASTETPSARHRRLWVLALGTAAVWHLNPALLEMAELIGMTACAGNKTLAKDAIAQMRAQAHSLRTQIAPMPASALAKVVRRAEAACGAVLNKGMRVNEVQTSWDHFLACMRLKQDTKT